MFNLHPKDIIMHNLLTVLKLVQIYSTVTVISVQRYVIMYNLLWKKFNIFNIFNRVGKGDWKHSPFLKYNK